jgi:hypothetical protein
MVAMMLEAGDAVRPAIRLSGKRLNKASGNNWQKGASLPPELKKDAQSTATLRVLDSDTSRKYFLLGHG